MTDEEFELKSLKLNRYIKIIQKLSAKYSELLNEVSEESLRRQPPSQKKATKKKATYEPDIIE